MANIRLMSLTGAIVTVLLSSCSGNTNSTGTSNGGAGAGLEVKFLVGSALEQFCTQAAEQLNQSQPKTPDGQAFYLSCESLGSGDVVEKVSTLARQLSIQALAPEDPQFPVLISVDGDIYQNQLLDQVSQYFPGQNLIPAPTDAPLLANSPMVFMTSAELAPGLRKQTKPYRALQTVSTHQGLDPQAPAQPIYFVQTAPTRSNSGLQTLVTQFAEVSGKLPEQLTVADVQKYQPQVKEIQKKVTRYGVSTGSLAKSMVNNGLFWASVASVYESSVIEANSTAQPGQSRYEAVYPPATFTSNMRAILPNAPWVSEPERAAAQQVIEFLRSPQTQTIATNLGLRPGVPGVPLGAKFSPQFGVDPNATYDSLRPPQAAVINAMLKSWQEFAKKPSLVVVVVDSSGSMKGDKLPAVQSTLQAYINGLGPQDKVAMIDFDSAIRPPVLITGTAAGRQEGLKFISSLKAEGGTRLYDSALAARNWLKQNLRSDGINAVLILTDGEDSESKITLEQLGTELQKTGFSSDERIAFFTIGYGNVGEFNPDALQQIANLNGGYYKEGNPQTIAQVMADLQVEF
jgi:Ca-activated chloride channel homolog